MGTITRNAANNFTTGGVILPAAINDTSVASLTELENVAAGGAMNLISEQTASNSSSISFTSGIDSTYPIYKFEFINIHPANSVVSFAFNMSTNGGSTYAVTKTSTHFYAYHNESDVDNVLSYAGGADLAQGTGDQYLATGIPNANDDSASGDLFIFNPSSTTFVKHFISKSNGTYSQNNFCAGYGNTTSAVNAIIFRMSSGNIDSGIIKMYGVV